MVKNNSQINKEEIYDFLERPYSKHSLNTLKILNKLRSVQRKGKYCLICIKPYKLWQLAKLTGIRGQSAIPIKGKYFNDLEEAERYVFKLRYKPKKNKK